MFLLLYIVNLLFFSPIIFGLYMLLRLLLQQKKQPWRRDTLRLILTLFVLSGSSLILALAPNTVAIIGAFVIIGSCLVVATPLILGLWSTPQTNKGQSYYHPAALKEKNTTLLNGKILFAGVIFYLIVLAIIQYLFLILTGYDPEAEFFRPYDLEPPGAGESDSYSYFPVMSIVLPPPYYNPINHQIGPLLAF